MDAIKRACIAQSPYALFCAVVAREPQMIGIVFEQNPTASRIFTSQCPGPWAANTGLPGRGIQSIKFDGNLAVSESCATCARPKCQGRAE